MVHIRLVSINVEFKSILLVEVVPAFQVDDIDVMSVKAELEVKTRELLHVAHSSIEMVLLCVSKDDSAL